jgi:hypothetical protein
MAEIIVWKGFEITQSEDEPNSYRFGNDEGDFSIYLAFDPNQTSIDHMWSASIQVRQMIGEAYAREAPLALTKALLDLYEDLLETRKVVQEIAERPVT